jgi:hypothetical protein
MLLGRECALEDRFDGAVDRLLDRLALRVGVAPFPLEAEDRLVERGVDA